MPRPTANPPHLMFILCLLGCQSPQQPAPAAPTSAETTPALTATHAPNMGHGSSTAPEVTYYQHCLALKRQNNIMDAIVSCKQAITLRPQFVAAHYTLGTLYRLQGHHGEAMEAFKQAATLDPENASAHAMHGAMLVRLEQYAEAESALNRALFLNPKDVSSWNNLGVALRKMDRPEEALAAYEEGLTHNPESAELLSNTAIAYSKANRYEEAKSTMERALAIEPNLESRRGYAIILRALGKWNEAIPHFEAWTRENPRDSSALFDLAYCYEMGGNNTAALATYEKLLALGTNDSNTRAATARRDVLTRSRR